jgi:hypothetical protein
MPMLRGSNSLNDTAGAYDAAALGHLKSPALAEAAGQTTTSPACSRYFEGALDLDGGVR